MVERLRDLLSRPIDPLGARAVVGLALAVGIGFSAVALLGAIDHDPAGGSDPLPAPKASALVAEGTEAQEVVAKESSAAAVAAQDRQDRPGTTAHRRARRELALHRALQHLPYRSGGGSIELVGARKGRAVLRVRAASIADAQRCYRLFLRRFHDDGHAYRPTFRGEAGGHGR